MRCVIRYRDLPAGRQSADRVIDPAHVAHDAAHGWFAVSASVGWATCPLTENGVIRIVGHASYPNTPGSPAAVASIFAGMRRVSDHVFWPDDVSLLASDHIDHQRILTSGQVTDTYLLALAVKHRGQLATLDRRLSTSAVRGGDAALHIVGNP